MLAILDSVLGELSALAAALFYSLASTTYTLAGRKFGASVSMALSLLISLVFLLPAHQFLQGEILPYAVSPHRWLILGASSLCGFVVSALFLLRSFQYIGPRLTMLVGSTSPIYAALMAWLLLGQALPTYAVAGIVLVVSGVFVVVSEDAMQFLNAENANYSKGLSMAFAAALTQGVSFVLMSLGVADGFPAMSASVIRTLVGLVLLVAFIAARGRLRRNLELIAAEPRALGLIVLASLTGPVIAATLVLVSLQFTSVGISSTLTGTTPILMIPISFVVFGERITARAVLGTIVAVAGVAVLFAS